MNTKFLLFLFSLIMTSLSACASDEPHVNAPVPGDNNSDRPESSAYFGGRKALVAYFSWGGTTQRMAREIQNITGADIFRIEPVVPMS